MARKKKDEAREERIQDEVIVDCNGEDERAAGWYYYLQDTLEFPFDARCIARRPTSVLKVNDEVKVLDLAPADDCEREMFVMIRWEKDGLAVPLSQLEPATETDDETRQAVADWHYWVEQGYEF